MAKLAGQAKRYQIIPSTETPLAGEAIPFCVYDENGVRVNLDGTLDNPQPFTRLH